MDFRLNEEQQLLHDTVFKFSKKEWEPKTLEIDAEARFPYWLWHKFREMGWCGLMVPEEYGGAGLGLLEMCIMFEAAAHAGGDTGTALAWGTHCTIGTIPIIKCGSPEQKQRYLPKLASGEWIGCFCLTEPNVGSDAAHVQCTAAHKGDHYVLNGSKMFITNGPNADVAIVIAATDKSRGASGLSAFIVEKGFSGFSVGKTLEKIGQHGSETSEIVFDNCIVPVENRLLDEGDGFKKVGAVNLEYERTGLTAIWAGNIGYNIDLAIAYAKQRVQFGHPIIEYAQIREKIAQMQLEYDICKLLMYSAASKKDRGEFAPLEATEFKVFCAQASVRSALEAIQIHGGYGLMREYKVERSLRDSKLGQVGAGTEQMLLELIARITTGSRSLTI